MRRVAQQVLNTDPAGPRIVKSYLSVVYFLLGVPDMRLRGSVRAELSRHLESPCKPYAIPGRKVDNVDHMYTKTRCEFPNITPTMV